MAQLRAVVHPEGLLDRRSGEHWAGRLYMRRVSVYVTWVALRLGLSANAVTGVMILVGLAAAGVLALPGVGAAVGAALLVQLYLLLDCSDGEVARWRGATSARGVYLDRLGHYLVEAALMVALGVRARDGDGLEWVLWGMVAALFVLVEKAETDLVDVARHRFGAAPATDEAAVMRHAGMAAGRRLAAYLPLHRVTHAVEASLLAVVAAFFGTDATRGLVVGMALVSGAVVVLHLVSVLSSRRLSES